MKEKFVQVGFMTLAVVLGVALIEYAIKPAVEKLKAKKTVTATK